MTVHINFIRSWMWSLEFSYLAVLICRMLESVLWAVSRDCCYYLRIAKKRKTVGVQATVLIL